MRDAKRAYAAYRAHTGVSLETGQRLPMKLTKQQRLDLANQIIVVISKYGRKFFSRHADGAGRGLADRISRFEIGESGRLKFRDKYTDRLIHMHQASYSAWRGFSEGGTLRSLVNNLARFITHGDEIANHFGPWREEMCGGDLWGYGLPESARMREEVAPLLKKAKMLEQIASGQGGQG